MSKSTIAADVKETHAKLNILEGEWDVTLSNLSMGKPGEIVKGKSVFSWIGDGAFLQQHSEYPGTPYPTFTAIMGVDDTTKKFILLYSDVRPAYRIVNMTLDNDSWETERLGTNFNQRFHSKISDHGKLITGYWEKSEDGGPWKKDFDIEYKKR